MRQTIYILVLLMAAQSNLSAQTTRPHSDPPCPTLSVECPSDLPQEGQTLTFKARVNGGDPDAKLTFNWTLSNGTINSGQGTDTITIIFGNSSPSTTATVKVGGMAAKCQNIASCTLPMAHPSRSRRFDLYGDVEEEDEQARLDHFASELNNNPGAQGYVIAYEEQGSEPGTAAARLGRIRDYVIGQRGIDGSRIVTVEGGRRQQTEIELWIVPTGATPPAATPDAEP